MNTIFAIALVVFLLVIGFCVGRLYEIENEKELNDGWLEFTEKELHKVSNAYEEKIKELESELEELRGE